MELIVIIRMLCISLSLLLTPSCASLVNHQPHSSYHLGDDEQQLTYPTLSRKLKFNEVPTVNEDEAHKGSNKEMEILSGKSHKKETQVMHVAARTGTRQEWIQRSNADPSQFFTMDYSLVRRGRPIHNKYLPVAP